MTVGDRLRLRPPDSRAPGSRSAGLCPPWGGASSPLLGPCRLPRGGAAPPSPWALHPPAALHERRRHGSAPLLVDTGNFQTLTKITQSPLSTRHVSLQEPCICSAGYEPGSGISVIRYRPLSCGDSSQRRPRVAVAVTLTAARSGHLGRHTGAGLGLRRAFSWRPGVPGVLWARSTPRMVILGSVSSQFAWSSCPLLG